MSEPITNPALLELLEKWRERINDGKPSSDENFQNRQWLLIGKGVAMNVAAKKIRAALAAHRAKHPKEA